MKTFQGSWTITALETEGNPMSSAVFGESKIIVTGDRFTTVSMGAAYNGTLRVDDAATPKTVDLLFTDGPHAGLTSPGIYKMRGDRWTICLGFAGMSRPTAFKTTPGSGHALETLTRDKPEAKSQMGPAATRAANDRPMAPENPPTPANAAPLAYPEEVARLGGEWSAVSIVNAGQPLAAQYLAMAKRVATGSEITVTVADQVQLHVTFTVDPTTTPRSMDYTPFGASAKAKKMLGIYALEGDLLTTLFMPAGQPRPITFASTLGDGRLSVWKRG